MIAGFATKYIIMAGVGLAVLATLFFLTLDLKHWKAKAEGYNAEAAAMYAATVMASDNHKLARRDTAKQILALGTSVDVLDAALKRQTKAVTGLVTQQELDRKAAQDAVSRSAGRVSAAMGASVRLAASARSPVLKTAPCEPSDELKRSWK